MAFSSEDLYTLSGGVNIFNYWNPYVTKHDTSGFYNWEQDNLPLYDLEERTHYLWEKFGYPLSGVPSMALVVSASIPTHLPLSSNVFTSIEDAVEALPEIIRMPTLIEVAVSGEIGALNLNNIKCEDDGVLEIVNRGFAPMLPSENCAYVQAPTNAAEFIGGVIQASAVLDTIDAASALSVSASTTGLFTADGIAGGYVRTIHQATYDNSSTGIADARPGYAIQSVNADGGATVFRSTEDLGLLEVRSVIDTTIPTLDLSTFSETDGTTEYKSDLPGVGDRVVGILTANSLSSIQVENSDGPIYIRGFIVDGYSDAETDHITETGIKVYNTNNLTLENCGAMRCTTAGADIKNSNVNLRRGFAATRNYDTADRGTIETVGLLAENSHIKLVTDTYTSGVDFLFSVQHQDVGVKLLNSRMEGGDARTATDRDWETVSIVPRSAVS